MSTVIQRPAPGAFDGQEVPASAVPAEDEHTVGFARPVAVRVPGQVRPLVDLTKIVVVGELVVGAVAVTWRLAGRPAAPKAYVRMGPGGWVSVKGGGVRLYGRRYRSKVGDRDRPMWARILRAHRAT